MAQSPFWKAKKRGGEDSPPFTKLGTAMNQGGGYEHGSPPRSLSAQMGQPGGYKHASEAYKKLQKLMGQGGS